MKITIRGQDGIAKLRTRSKGGRINYKQENLERINSRLINRDMLGRNETAAQNGLQWSQFANPNLKKHIDKEASFMSHL